MNGQAIKETIYVIKPTVSTPIQVQTKETDGCVPTLPALAEYTPTDDHFNDRHSVIWFFDDLFTDAKIYLQKDQKDLIELTDNTFGTFYPYGFFVNKFNEKAIGFLIEWTKVLNAHGPGSYRIRNSSTRAIGTFPDQYSFEFNLQVYTPDRANRTVRAEWNRNGVLGSRISDEKVEDYGTLNWFNQIRIPNSMFGFDTSELTEEYVRYPNGSNVWITDKQVEELTWNIWQLPQYVHRFIQVDVMQAGKIKVTDYNKLVPTPTIDRWVVPTSGYKPEWIIGTQNANVTVTFKPYFENLTHKRE
jgi:hypothetical protein